MPRSPREGGLRKREREREKERKKPGDPGATGERAKGAGPSIGVGPISTYGGSVGGVAKWVYREVGATQGRGCSRGGKGLKGPCERPSVLGCSDLQDPSWEEGRM